MKEIWNSYCMTNYYYQEKLNNMVNINTFNWHWSIATIVFWLIFIAEYCSKYFWKLSSLFYTFFTCLYLEWFHSLISKIMCAQYFGMSQIKVQVSQFVKIIILCVKCQYMNSLEWYIFVLISFYLMTEYLTNHILNVACAHLIDVNHVYCTSICSYKHNTLCKTQTGMALYFNESDTIV